MHAVHVEIDPEQTGRVREAWERLGAPVPLRVLSSPYRSFVRVLVDYITEVDARRGDDVVTVLLVLSCWMRS